MSDQTQDEPHYGPIKTAKQFFWTSVGAFVVPMFVIIGLVFWVTSGSDRSPGETNPAQKVQQRIAPVASVKVGDPTQSEAPEGGAAPQTASADAGTDLAAAGKKLYESTCIACHGTGAAGAPKFGDKDAWAPRIAEGMDAMMKIAIDGKGAMPPRGGSSASDEELQAAVIYMADASGGDFAKDEKKDTQEAAAPAETGAAASDGAGSGGDAAAEKPDAKDAKTPDDANAAGASEAPEVDLAAGKKLYESTCFACHGTGAAGAPKFGDKDAWAPRIAEGMDAMMKIAIDGKGAMPPRGGSSATDDEMRDAVAYMVEHSK